MWSLFVSGKQGFLHKEDYHIEKLVFIDSILENLLYTTIPSHI